MNTLRNWSPGPPAPSPRNKRYQTRTLWRRLLGGSRGAVSECGRLRQRAGGHLGGDRRRSVPMLPTLFAADGDRQVDRAGDAGTLVGADRCTLSQRERAEKGEGTIAGPSLR